MTEHDWRVDGPRSAPVLVLLPSLGTTSEMWEPQLPVLTDWFRVVRIEHPGHGGVPAPAGPYTVASLGERVLAVLENLGVATASVAGASLGGLIGMWLAVKHPARVDRLVLCCSAPWFGEPASWLERAEVVRRDGTGPLWEAAIGRWFTAPFRELHPGVVDDFATMLSGVEREGYAGCCEALAAADLRDDLHRIEAPTLVVSGADDPVVPPESAVSTMGSIPGASLTVLRGAAHLASVELPDAFNDAVLAHLVGTAGERGLATRRAVLGDSHVDAALAGASAFTAPFQRFVTRLPWGELWSRPGLDRRTRRLVTIGMLAALGRSAELAMHVRAAVRDGMDADSLREVLLHTAVYAGFPAANEAFPLVDRILAEETDPG